MKRLIFILILIFALSETLLGAQMEDYCAVPPYVIQNVAPNVMIVLDNSGSMFNFAYACPAARTTSSGTNTKIIPLDNTAGFKRGMKILVGNTKVVVDSVSSSSVTVTTNVSFSQGALVQDYGCFGTLFYEIGGATCTSPTPDCPCATAQTSGTNQSVINVNNADFFWVGQLIVVYSGGTPQERIIVSIDKPNKKITVDTPVSFISGDKIYDYSCFYFNNPYPEQSFEPTKKYYGYFNPDYWYTYSTSGGKFIPSRPKSAGSKASNEWDGNFLNWLTMRRVDIVRRVMTGGNAVGGEGTGWDKLRTEKADSAGRGIYKAITHAENYMGCSGCSGNMNFTFSTGSSNPSSFEAFSGNASSGFTSRGTFSVDVRVPAPVEGVLQRVVGARARIGLTFYRTYEGGYVQVYVSGGSLSSTVNQINLTRPSANTPLAETLWTVAGYFAQQSSISAIGTPGPRYASGDYQINNNVDPLNYGTGGNPIYRSCAKSFVLYITDGEPCADGNLPAALSDYANGRSPYNCQGSSCPSVSPFSGSTLPSCSAGGNVAGIEDVALWMHITDLRNKDGTPNIGVNNIPGIQNLTLYTVFAFGKGSTLLRYAAINGGFEDLNGNNLPDLQAEWDANGDNEPDTFYEATDGAELERAIEAAFTSILKRASSGTAASVLASGEGQGANIIQAIFYPRRRFGNDVIAWTGSLQNLWYYVDPLFATSSIREETIQDLKLNLTNDYIAQLYFDTAAQNTYVKLFEDSNGDGNADNTTPIQIIPIENLKAIWEAGKLLWSRDLNAEPRRIYTSCLGGACTNNLLDFSTSNKTILRPYLQAVDDTEAEKIIKYLHGEDIIEDLDGDQVNDWRLRSVTLVSDTNVWKLGDILNSTPRIASWLPLNSYHIRYNDTSYKAYINTNIYRERGYVFAGANDGLLHAFRLGKLEFPTQSGTTCTFSSNDKACLSGYDLGKELWAFIPKHVLPYLKYYGNPEYCHIYTVDLTPYIFDASIGTTGCTEPNYWDCDKNVSDPTHRWRTILIGGMRTGGACRGTNVTCTDVNGDGSKDCVNTPVDIGGNSVGYSSYFALDITDPENPVLLWEFSHQQLGFTTTGPAVVRIAARNNDGSINNNKNGHWYVIFGSGPTGPIDKSVMQFMGRSDQNLRFFILDLKTGTLLRIIDTGISYAFAGSMISATEDLDSNYQDEVVYVGYVKRSSSTPYAWTNGGIGRIMTDENPDPSQWQWRILMDNIGPVTSAIETLQNPNFCDTKKGSETVKGCVWLFFGTGRYYYATESGVDDQSSQRHIFGIKEPCITASGQYVKIDYSCTLTYSFSDLTNVTDINNVPSETIANSISFNGWLINLDLPSSNYGAERVITDPLASTIGVVFYTTTQPYTDPCSIGGKSYIWAVKYNTGGAPGGLLKGTALLQVSTAAIEQIDLSMAFTGAGGRKSYSLEGVPPVQQGLSIMTSPKPVKRIIHMRER